MTKRKATSYGSKSKVLERRAATARVLEALDTSEPRPAIPEGRTTIGSLVRRGYVKKVGDGYIRTGKEFAVEKPKNGNGAASHPDDELMTVAQAAKRLKVSDSYVRLLIKQKQLAGHWESRVPKGRTKAVKRLLLTADDVARYKAEQMA